MLVAVMSKSMCVSDLKLALRTLVSGLSMDTSDSEPLVDTNEVSELSFMLRRMLASVLLRCAEREVGGSYFSFGGYANRSSDKQGKRSNASAGVCGSSAGGGAIGIRWLLYALFNFYPYDSSQHIFSQQQYSKSRSGSMAAQSPPSNTSISTSAEDPCNDKRTLSQGRPADGVGDQIPGDTAGYSDANDDSYGSGGAEPSLLGLRGFDMLCHIIECDDDKTAAVAIDIVVLLLTKYSATKEQESTASRITNSLRGRSSLAIEPDDISRGPDTDILRSFVGLLPARLIKIPDAWSAIFDLSCASNTDPELRPIVSMDFYRLLEDDPANYDTANSSRFKLLDHLIVAIVLAGCLVDDNSASLNNATSSNVLATDPKTLSEMYSKVTGFLELIPHTTLDYNMQNLSTGHIKAHKSWIQNRIVQLRISADTTPKTWDQSQTFDNADELQTRASSELMSSMLVWSKTSCTLFMAIVWNSFSSQPGCADDVYMFVLKLWPLMPTGSMSIAIRLLLLVFSESQMRITRQLREEQSVSETAHVLDWVLTQNLESFVQDALDLLFNYRQFQEYIAHNHDQLKTMSTVSQPSGPRVSIDDHDIVYHSQHSPWDDTPELTRAIVDFMFCLDQCGSGLRAPMCNHILRLVISGIRSVKMEHVEESLKSLARVLDYHPYLDQVLSTLGYVHEAFMFAEDQTDSTRFDNPDEQSSCSRDSQVELRERLGELYMLVFQGYHAYLASEYPAALLPLRLQQQRQRQGGGGGSLDKSQFVAFLQSEEWQGLYRTKFMPAMRKTEESEMRQAGMSRSRFADTLREILVGSQRQESMQMRAVKAAQTAIANSTLPIEADETASVRSEILGSPTGHWPRVWHKGQDASGDEEWNLVTSEDLNIVSATKGTAGTSDPRRAHFAASCERVALLGSVAGHVEITSTLLRFTAERDSSGSVCVRGSDGAIVGVSQNHANVDKKGRSLNPKGPTLPKVVYAELTRDITWRLSDIDQVHFRRYMLRNSAVEVFFKDHSSVFMNIENKKALMQLVWKLASLPSVNSELALTDIRSPPALLNRTKLTERWQHGELSNFEYLMALNTIAGRSYNDLSQYPVFPWVICDYKSKWLDLKDPRVYRDLSRPIGALNEKRLSHFIERYESFEDPTGRIKKFHYGTHYSSASAVAYYLLRLEPFTSVHVSLQSGKFDHADRQFYSIAETWNSCMTGPGDVKELIPEFFYLPEFLVNSNGVDLGKKQDGTLLGDVSLPPWASTPDEFVQIHRQALESEYVSANLHKWIDLVFGYKQRGHEAIKAHNVFYYLTYEGAVNLDAIQDPVERASVESQIHYFGQTPTQLFSSPHPPRHTPIAQPLYSPLTNPGGKVQYFILRASNSNITFVGSSQCFFSERRRAYFNSRSVPWTACANPPNSLAPLPSNIEQLDNGGDGVDTQRSTETITLVDSNGGVSIYQLSLFTNSDYKFQLTVEPFVEGFYMLAASSPPSECQRLALADQRPVAYAVLPNVPELIVSAVHFDNTLKCARLTRNRESAPAETTVQASLVRNTTLSASTTMSMTNAYASAVVGAMSRETRGLGERSSRVGDKSTTSSATSKRNAKESNVRSQASSSRTLSGILASIGGNVGGSGAARSGSEHSNTEVHDDKSGMSAPPSVFIPLASRLLDTTSAFSDIPLPGQQMCVAADGCGGSRVAVGSSDGSICILNIVVSAERTSGSTTAAIAATAMFGSDFATSGMERTSAMAPLLFATGMGNPMDVEIGHTSMAAYASSTSSPSALFGEGRSAIGGGIAGGSSGGSASGSNAGGHYNSSVGDGKAGSWTLQHVLHGHDAAVLDVAVDSDHDVVAGASVDGTVSLWTVRTGRYLRSLVPVCPSITHPDDAIPAIARHQNRCARVERVLISSEALVICYSVSGALGADDNRDRLDPTRAFNQTLLTMPGQSLGSESGSLSNSHSASSQDRYSHYYNSQKSNVSDGSSRREGKAADDNNPQGSPIDDGAFEIAALHVYTINGRHLRTRKLVHHLRDIALTKDGKYGVCVNLNSRVAIFETNTLSIVRQFELPACGCSVSWSGASERQIIVGCEGGLVVVISADLSVVH
ncbi:hypothetical protein LPJ72_002038 [Coemansia sp. Benny D160-2]|nr:hypothetical protein LPJ72_002038 [Coemansia sp. Benny D160-2]